jgi:hypothetical protein
MIGQPTEGHAPGVRFTRWVRLDQSASRVIEHHARCQVRVSAGGQVSEDPVSQPLSERTASKARVFDFAIQECGVSGCPLTCTAIPGIAYDANGDRLFVTGKNWPKLFGIRLVKKAE